ncbi:MAG: START domain-containing protein [Arenicella sp.]
MINHLRVFAEKCCVHIICLSLILLSTAYAGDWQQYDWQLKKQQDDIEVSIAKVPGSAFRAVLSQMTVTSSISSLVALVMNVSDCPNWVDICVESEIIRRVSPTEYYQYSISQSPWPVHDRDVLMHVSIQQDEAGVVRINGQSQQGMLNKRKGLIRIQQAQSIWVFTPLLDGKIQVQNFVHADPAGAIPSWLLNKQLIDNPFKTLRNMRLKIASEPYQKAQFPFIREVAITQN